MPEVCIVAEELTCGNTGDEMVVIKVSDRQLNPCPLVVVFPYCFGSHINLIMTDDLTCLLQTGIPTGERGDPVCSRGQRAFSPQ